MRNSEYFPFPTLKYLRPLCPCNPNNIWYNPCLLYTSPSNCGRKEEIIKTAKPMTSTVIVLGVHPFHSFKRIDVYKRQEVPQFPPGLLSSGMKISSTSLMEQCTRSSYRSFPLREFSDVYKRQMAIKPIEAIRDE